MAQFFSNIWFYLRTVLNTFSWRDALDILLVAFLIYKAIGLLIHTRTGLLIKGLLFLFAAYTAATLLQLKTIKYLIDYLFKYGLVVLVVVFQPEIRTVLERIGRTEFGLNLFSAIRGTSQKSSAEDTRKMLDTVCGAAESMSRTYTGALIVFERETPLNEILSTGTAVDAEVSEELLGNIFYKGAPLHDGAVVIRGGRVAAAGCILPVSRNLEISKEMGTRHRAAIGMSENSDAVVLVVSEENGYISIAQDGAIKRHLTRSGAYKLLCLQMLPNEEEEEKKEKKNILRRKKS